MSNFLQVKTPIFLQQRPSSGMADPSMQQRPSSEMDLSMQQRPSSEMAVPMGSGMEMGKFPYMGPEIDTEMGAGPGREMNPMNLLKETMNKMGLFAPLAACGEIRPLQNMPFLGESSQLSCDELAGMLMPGEAGSALFGSGMPQEQIVDDMLTHDAIKGLLSLVPYAALVKEGGMEGMVEESENGELILNSQGDALVPGIQRLVVDDIVGHCMLFCGNRAREIREKRI